MDIGELYDSIDWTKGQKALGEWMEEHRPEQAEGQRDEHDSEFSRAGRCWQIAYALPAELVGHLDEFTTEIQHDARRCLHRAGVWTQIVDYLEARGYFGIPTVPEPAKDPEQLALFEENEQLTPTGD